MIHWRELFERAAAHVPDREEMEIRYQFGKPASESDLARLERHHQGQLPNDLRALLAELNGIEVKEKYWGEEWHPLYLSVDQMLGDVVDYIETSGNPMPPADQLACVAFFAHQNGFAELYCVCTRAFQGFAAGQVLVLDHETGEFELAEKSLSEFVSNPEYCSL